MAIEQAYATARWNVREGAYGLDRAGSRSPATRSAGTSPPRSRFWQSSPKTSSFVHAVDVYPVTDAAQDTGSYEQFAEGYFLTAKAMEWFWDAYIVRPDAALRDHSRHRTTPAIEQHVGLPPTLLLVDEADVLRDEAEAYAAKLRLARCPRHDRPLRRRPSTTS